MYISTCDDQVEKRYKHNYVISEAQEHMVAVIIFAGMDLYLLLLKTRMGKYI